MDIIRLILSQIFSLNVPDYKVLEPAGRGKKAPATSAIARCTILDAMSSFNSRTRLWYLPAAAGLLIASFSAASAQAPAPAPLQTPNPHYVSIPLEVAVNRPAAEVWKRVGKFCDIHEFLQVDCVITSGKDGEFGAVRALRNGAVVEILVAKTGMSYTYTQPVREGQRYNLYHATVEAVPVSATTSKVLYTLVFDNSMLADDAAREKDIQQRTAQFTRALYNMKTLAEGGTIAAR